MRCAICNSEDDSITFDKQDGRFSPCRTCQDVIYDCITSYENNDDKLLEDDHV